MKAIILAIIGAYAAGSVNFAILLFKMLGKDDPRTVFSGNPGVTNVYRHSGYFLAFVVLLLDVGRAMGVAWICASLLQMEFVPWAGLGLVLGNRFPCFHHWRGGKGVANYLGFTTIIAPLAAGISALAWVTTYVFFRTPFIGSFVMVFILGTGTLLACDFDPIAAAGVLATAALIYHGHKPNLLDFVRKRRNGSG